MKKYDVAVIGGGIGGLISAQIMSMEGKSVIVLEKNKIFGGAIQGFKRKGLVFDTGAHYLGGMESGQNLNQYFKYLGIFDKLNIEKMDTDCFDEVILNSSEKRYKYAQGFENFVDVMAKDFPENRADIQKYVDKIIAIGDYYPLFSLNFDNGYQAKINEDHMNQSIGEVLDSITDNETLKDVLTATNLVYAGDKYRTPFYIHALIINSYISSSYRIIGGANQISDLLIEQIKAKGNTVRNKAEVVKYIFGEGKEIEAVELADGEKIYADSFISNIHPALSMKMIPKNKIRKSYRKRIESLDNTYSVFSIYVVLKPNTQKYINNNIYSFNDDSVWDQGDESKNWPNSFIMMTAKSDMDSIYADGVGAISPMDYKMVEQWKDTEIYKRPQSFKDFKNKIQEIMLDNMEKRIPNIRKNAVYIETHTPLTYEHYTASPKGALYGIIRDSKDPYRTQIKPYTKVPNLTFVGQNIENHGVLGVAIGCFMAAGLSLDLKYILNKVKNA